MIISLQKDLTPARYTPYIDCRSAVREAYKRKELDEALKLALASLTYNTCQYCINTGLKAWWKFCNDNETSPFKITELL